MSLRSVTVLACLAICLLCAFTTRADQNARDPYPGETIAQYIEVEFANITEYAQVLLNDTAKDDGSKNPNVPVETNDTAQLNDRDIQETSKSIHWKPSPLLNKPSLLKPAQVDLSATYNGSDGRGYNITIPGCTPADSVIGDWEAPSGDLIENCTLAQMSTKLNLPSAMRLNFTMSRAQSLLEKLNTSLENAVCEPELQPPDRELKAEPPGRFRFNPETQSGYYSSLLLVLLGSFGISFTGLHLGIIHEGITANITLTQEVLILSSFATFGTMCVIMIERERRRLAHAEAVVLNLFIAMAEKIWGEMHTGVAACVPEVPLAQGVQSLAQKLSQGARMLVTEDVQAAAMRTAGSSSVNLVGQVPDVENQLSAVLGNGNSITNNIAKALNNNKVC